MPRVRKRHIDNYLHIHNLRRIVYSMQKALPAELRDVPQVKAPGSPWLRYHHAYRTAALFRTRLAHGIEGH